MEAKWRWVLITAIAPIAWGSTYVVTRQLLPADIPLWGAALRALPAGLLLLGLRPGLPRGSWWLKALVLGTLNMGAFFALVYVAAQLLPSSIAATIMATSPLAMMLLAAALVSERLRALPLAGAAVGLVGVALLVLTGPVSIDAWGVAASLAAMALSSLGYILAKRWQSGVDVVTVTAWQLIAGGLLLVPAALVVEGPVPALTPIELGAFAYVGIIATAVAFVAWFSGLAHLDAASVGLIGLLNPVTGVLLGTLVAGEVLSGRQVVGLLLVLTGVLLGQPIAARLRGRRRRLLSGP
ncbi:DMT family transporter [Agromyces atrinae]|uniref:EamA family transporter n=1 Tax=Agromyces atrinae TaxID=592376 RepID=A0A4Q2M959_9MICO|nr:DMT family transporter [Agromyces atrinae]NYD67235.1 putative blue pigment (indigoidine) exporter [Agromyces atrinae]RXZ86933.1 EamA family transporter [Agromyces atrinae]